MTRSQVAVIVLVALVLLVVLGLIAARVGGSSVRTSGQMRIGQLTLSSSRLLFGAPVTVTYDLISLESVEDASIVMMRTPSDSQVIGEVTKEELASGKFLVTVPCEKAETLDENIEGRLVLVANKNQSVLAQSGSFRMLPSGPECIYN